MALTYNATIDDQGRSPTQAATYRDAPRAQASAVSWGAIVAGAAAAAALSLILLILGTGLGLSAVSPWVGAGIDAATFGVSTILWLTLTSLAASGIGGYLAGRLRTPWIAVHADEAYFRDSAHGFLAWAVASLTTAALLTSSIGAIVGSGVRAAAGAAGDAATVAAASAAATGARMAMPSGDASAYFVDALFRKEPNAAAANASTDAAGPARAAAGAEVARIFLNAGPAQALPEPDLRYAGQLVAAQTGLTQQEAEKRVGDTHARIAAKARDAQTSASEAADKARRASAYAALWLFVSLLGGAFVASLAATFGGRFRDA